MSKNTDERFWTKVQKAGLEECWLWSGCLVRGYGQFNNNGQRIYAHRFSYESRVGDVPNGLDLDHLCRNRACVNPLHLEPVTRSENLRRGEWPNAAKTHCIHGHAFDEGNTILNKRGHRNCRACKNATRRKENV